MTHVCEMPLRVSYDKKHIFTPLIIINDYLKQNKNMSENNLSKVGILNIFKINQNRL